LFLTPLLSQSVARFEELTEQRMNPSEFNEPSPASRPVPDLKGLEPRELLRTVLQIDSDDLGGTIALERSSLGEDPASQTKYPTPHELTALLPDGTYMVEEFLNHGGMGAVYKGTQIRLRRSVAIKVMRRDSGIDHDFETRFEREAQSMAKLSHPNIVSVIDFGEAGTAFLYIVMELVDGVDMMQVINAGEMTQEVALSVLPQICDALQFAHDHGIVHRDIKPSNIMLTHNGQVKMTDFGLAKRCDSDFSALTQAGTGMGTPDYAAPEQFNPELSVDHRADIYALGVMIYQMITGTLPRGAWKPASERAAVATQWDQIITRAMQHDPAERYQQASEVKKDVSGINPVSGKKVSVTGHGCGDDSKAEQATASPDVGTRSSKWRGPLSSWVLFFGSASAAIVYGFYAAMSPEPVATQTRISAVDAATQLAWLTFDFASKRDFEGLDPTQFEGGHLRLNSYRAWRLPNFQARNLVIRARVRWEKGKTDFKLRGRCVPDGQSWPKGVWGLFLDRATVAGYSESSKGEPALADFPAKRVLEDLSDVVVGLVLFETRAFLSINGKLVGSVDNVPIDLIGGAQIDAKEVLVESIEVASLDGFEEAVALELAGLTGKER
jgi:serine/threonine protein kinase